MAHTNNVNVVGQITEEIINGLGLHVNPGANILCGDTNIEHMKRSHPEDYDKYGHLINEILSDPNYISLNPNDNSIRYIKRFDENVTATVRVTANSKLFVRSLYVISEAKIDHYRSSSNFLEF